MAVAMGGGSDDNANYQEIMILVVSHSCFVFVLVLVMPAAAAPQSPIWGASEKAHALNTSFVEKRTTTTRKHFSTTDPIAKKQGATRRDIGYDYRQKFHHFIIKARCLSRDYCSFVSNDMRKHFFRSFK